MTTSRKSDLKVYKTLAEKTLALDDDPITTLIATGTFIEIADKCASKDVDDEDDKNDKN